MRSPLGRPCFWSRIAAVLQILVGAPVRLARASAAWREESIVDSKFRAMVCCHDNSPPMCNQCSFLVQDWI